MADVEAITRYISADRPIAARAMGQRLLAIGESLAGAPDRGRSISNGRRELIALSPYVVRYRVVRETVFILEVLHGARLRGMEEGGSIFDCDDEGIAEAAILRGEIDADAGRVFSHKAMKAWLLSWRTPNELPPPKLGD